MRRSSNRRHSWLLLSLRTHFAPADDGDRTIDFQLNMSHDYFVIGIIRNVLGFTRVICFW